MTIEEADLDAASAAGIVTADQADALRAFVLQRERQRAAELSHEERFRFMRGFNDFFFAVGIALFGGGMAFFAAPSPAGSLLAAAIIWALSELLVARMRLVLPGILLACFFLIFFVLASPIELLAKPSQLDGFGWSQWFWDRRSLWQTAGVRPRFSPDTAIGLLGSLYMLAGALGAGLFYLRFRLPFTLLLLAGCLVAMLRAIAHLLWPDVAAQINAPILLACGLLVFVAAMGFDTSDRDRTTLRADCAFWLHLLAAPLIVHSLISLMTPSAYLMTTPVAIAILAIFSILTVVAIVIDRRALLVSALIYIGIVIAYGIRAVGPGSDQASVFFVTLLIVGSVVLIIGVGWQPLRRVLLARLPDALRYHLPEAGLAGEVGPLRVP